MVKVGSAYRDAPVTTLDAKSKNVLSRRVFCRHFVSLGPVESDVVFKLAQKTGERDNEI